LARRLLSQPENTLPLELRITDPGLSLSRAGAPFIGTCVLYFGTSLLHQQHRGRTVKRTNIEFIIASAIAAIFLVTALVAQNAGVAANQGAGQAGTPTGSVLRITAPQPGAHVQQTYINLQFELTNGGASAAGMPDFQLKLDSQDPVTTNSTNYTFTGLTPGPHTIAVQLVDANGTPIAGARSEVPFIVVQQAANAPSPRAAILLQHRQSSMIQAAMRVEEPKAQAATDEDRPSAAGALPLLSVIGFGVLLGGIASAMKTRPR